MGNPHATRERWGTVTTGTQSTQEPNKPDLNKKQQVVQGLLMQLGLQATPTQPTGCAVSGAGGEFGDCLARAEACVSQSLQRALGLTVGAHAACSSNSQKTTTEATVALTGGSREVDCRPCNGCCGGRRWRRLPGRVYDFVAWVAGVRGVAMCQVLNEYPELFCRGLKRGRLYGVNRVKELERLLSREGEYKASYVLDRLRECLNDAVCWRYLRLGVEGWFRVVHLLANREPGDVNAYFSGLVRGLGFSGVVEFARYLRLVSQGLVDFNYVNRGRGYRDVLSVRCRMCGRVIDVAGPLPGVLFNLVRHFRVDHGLARPGDVEAKLRELEGRGAERPEGDDVGIKLLRHSGEVAQLIRLVVHRLMDVGLLERIGKFYRCRRCNGDVGDAIDALAHVMDYHYDVVDKLLSGRSIPSAGGINDAVDELASLFNSSNPDGVKPVVKALVQGIIDVLNARGSASVRMLTRWLSESEDYEPLLNSLTTGSVKPDRAVAMIVEVLARHGIVHVDGEVVRLGD